MEIKFTSPKGESSIKGTVPDGIGRGERARYFYPMNYNINCPHPGCEEETLLLLTETCATYDCPKCGRWSHKVIRPRKIKRASEMNWFGKIWWYITQRLFR